MKRLLCLVVCCFGFTINGVAADGPMYPSDAAVREAVSRSLVFLEREGVAWMDERGCISCHHVSFLLWSHRAAQSHGLPVDVTKLAAWAEWARTDSLSHRNLFRLQSYPLSKVDPGKLPDAVKEKLKPLIEAPFKAEPEFVAKLAQLLSENEQKAYQEVILATARREPSAVDRAGGGLDVLGQLLLGNPEPTSESGQHVFRDGIVTLMHEIQLDDGSWTPGKQFATMRRWSLPEANQTTTMWAALALATSDGPESKRSAVLEKAIAYQRHQPPYPENHEWLATRVLFALQFDSADQVARMRQQFLDARNSDGGWGWEKGVPSDAYTTGLALYVLAKTRTADNPADYRDARKWLLTRQQPDASWLTPSENITKTKDPERLKARDEIYQYWGTAWAAIGLLETLGISDS